MIEHLTQELAASEAALAEAREQHEDDAETIRELRDEIAEAWSEVCDNPDIKQGDAGELRQGVREACDAAYEQGGEGMEAAKDALRNYLVATGRPAAPVGSLGCPHLDALCEALL